jgi:hypothetical protein
VERVREGRGNGLRWLGLGSLFLLVLGIVSVLLWSNRWDYFSADEERYRTDKYTGRSEAFHPSRGWETVSVPPRANSVEAP